jgi:hypothetical protein
MRRLWYLGALGLASAFAVTPADAADADGFQRTVAPFLARHCTKCHGSELTEGEIRLDKLKPAGAATVDKTLWLKMLKQLSLGTMPPEDEPRPEREDVENVAHWIRDTLKIPEVAADIAELPGFGNYVDHRALFTEPAVRRAASPARLWRISPYIFRHAVNSVSGKPLLVVKKNQGGEGLHPALPFLTPQHSFRDLALPHSFEEATTELLVDMAWLVSGYQLDARRPPAALSVALAGEDTRAYEKAIRYQFGLVVQRDPTPEEIERLVELGKRTENETGRREALQTVLAAVLVMPEAVFRIETGAGKADEHGRAMLAPRELAFAISYALTDSPPDDALRAAVATERLSSRDDARREVERLLHDESIEKPRILRFFREYFEYTRATEIFKDGRIRKHYMPEQLVEDADALVLAALADDRDVLRRLLTTSEYYVNYGPKGTKGVNRPDRRQNWYYELFNLPHEWEWEPKQPIQFGPQRAGMLTHPAWLISFSDNEKNQAIQRGLWIRTKLLGGTVHDVPIGVDAQLPTDAKLTLREKMLVTRQEYCWKCHQKMDPLGLPFEQFDDFGIFRTKELERPVDTTGAIETGLAELDGPTQNPFEYVERLASSKHVEQVFVRHAFRYWMGRNETLDDAPTLIDAHRAYTEHGGSMKALLTSLLTSDSFLYRRLTAASPTAQR